MIKKCVCNENVVKGLKEDLFSTLMSMTWDSVKYLANKLLKDGNYQNLIETAIRCYRLNQFIGYHKIDGESSWELCTFYYFYFCKEYLEKAETNTVRFENIFIRNGDTVEEIDKIRLYDHNFQLFLIVSKLNEELKKLVKNYYFFTLFQEFTLDMTKHEEIIKKDEEDLNIIYIREIKELLTSDIFSHISLLKSSQINKSIGKLSNYLKMPFTDISKTSQPLIEDHNSTENLSNLQLSKDFKLNVKKVILNNFMSILSSK